MMQIAPIRMVIYYLVYFYYTGGVIVLLLRMIGPPIEGLFSYSAFLALNTFAPKKSTTLRTIVKIFTARFVVLGSAAAITADEPISVVP